MNITRIPHTHTADLRKEAVRWFVELLSDEKISERRSEAE